MSGDAEHRPRLRVGLIVALVAALAVLCCGGTTAAYFLDNLNGSPGKDTAGGADCGVPGHVIDVNVKIDRISSLGDDQMKNAAVIIIASARRCRYRRGAG